MWVKLSMTVAKMGKMEPGQVGSLPLVGAVFIVVGYLLALMQHD